jgi:hypothetical protein
MHRFPSGHSLLQREATAGTQAWRRHVRALTARGKRGVPFSCPATQRVASACAKADSSFGNPRGWCSKTGEGGLVERPLPYSARRSCSWAGLCLNKAPSTPHVKASKHSAFPCTLACAQLQVSGDQQREPRPACRERMAEALSWKQQLLARMLQPVFPSREAIERETPCRISRWRIWP